MGNETLFDAPLFYKFCASLSTAEKQAFSEVADTGGVVLRVKSIRIEPSRLIVIGLIRSDALDFDDRTETLGYLRRASVGSLYLTWSSLLHPKTTEDIGYLVLRTPIVTTGPLPESEDEDCYWVALPIYRVFHTLTAYSVGTIFCTRCNRPIPHERLLAIPRTRFCTNCQQEKEKKNDRGDQ